MAAAQPKAATKKYKVLGNIHEDKGTIYPKGSHVESEHDLIKQFPGKFALVHSGEAPESQPFKSGEQITRDVEGKKATEEGHPVNPETTREGRKANEEAGLDTTNVPEVHPTMSNVAADDDPDTDANAVDDDDVTEDFPDAEENDFVVSRKAKKYYVYDKDDKNRATPLNPDGSPKKDVKGVISKAIGKSK